MGLGLLSTDMAGHGGAGLCWQGRCYPQPLRWRSSAWCFARAHTKLDETTVTERRRSGSSSSSRGCSRGRSRSSSSSSSGCGAGGGSRRRRRSRRRSGGGSGRSRESSSRSGRRGRAIRRRLALAPPPKLKARWFRGAGGCRNPAGATASGLESATERPRHSSHMVPVLFMLLKVSVNIQRDERRIR